MSSPTYKGACLCKDVQVTATVKSVHIGACHCSICRAWGGGPFLAAECGQDVQFSGEDKISVFASSEWAERGFCSQCGTHLFYRLKEGGFYALSIGLFGQQDWALSEEIFIDEKPAFYDFAQETKKMTGAEVFAQFGATP